MHSPDPQNLVLTCPFLFKYFCLKNYHGLSSKLDHFKVSNLTFLLKTCTLLNKFQLKMSQDQVGKVFKTKQWLYLGKVTSIYSYLKGFNWNSLPWSNKWWEKERKMLESWNIDFYRVLGLGGAQISIDCLDWEWDTSNFVG